MQMRSRRVGMRLRGQTSPTKPSNAYRLLNSNRQVNQAAARLVHPVPPRAPRDGVKGVNATLVMQAAARAAPASVPLMPPRDSGTKGVNAALVLRHVRKRKPKKAKLVENRETRGPFVGVWR